MKKELDKKALKAIADFAGTSVSEFEEYISWYDEEYKRLKHLGIKNHITDLYEYKGPIFKGLIK